MLSYEPIFVRQDVVLNNFPILEIKSRQPAFFVFLFTYITPGGAPCSWLL